MKKFNSLFVAGQTKVRMQGEYGFRLVSEVNENRTLIKIDGIVGQFQLGDIIAFTNKTNAEMFPALADLYVPVAKSKVKFL